MTTGAPYIQLDEGCNFVVKSVASLHQKLKAKLTTLALCKEIDQSVFADDARLQISQNEQNDCIDFIYAGTRIRLTLVVGFEKTTAVGKVLVTHENALYGKPESHELGEFYIDETGRTNFIEHSGKPYFIKEAADLIVSYYLAEAYKRTLRIEPRGH